MVDVRKLPFSVKKDLFGAANLPAVGGSLSESGGAGDAGTNQKSENQKKRAPTDLEPVFYHAMPHHVSEEMFQGLPPSSIVDFTPGDGKVQILAAKKRIPCLAVCFTDTHSDLLKKRVEAEIFKAMLDENDKLFEPTLVTLLKKKAAKPNADVISDDDGDSQEDSEEEGEDEENEESEGGQHLAP